MVFSLWGHRRLIVQMTTRDVIGRYKGSFVGIFWSLLNPLIMLAVYTFVFSVVFKARWGASAEESRTEFAVVLFVGMIVHGFLAEVLTGAPAVILSNVNFVKKVIFPLEILPVVRLAASLFHSAVSLLVLVAAIAMIHHGLPWTVVFAPLVLLPLIVLGLGVAWLLASLGVFLRDIGQSMGLVTMLLMFLAPVFFPVSALPEAYRAVLMANPLTFIIEESRAVLIWGRPPHWIGLGCYAAASLLVAWVGYAWFQKTRKGFADVI